MKLEFSFFFFTCHMTINRHDVIICYLSFKYEDTLLRGYLSEILLQFGIGCIWLELELVVFGCILVPDSVLPQIDRHTVPFYDS